MASKERLQQVLERNAAMSSSLTSAWRDSVVSDGDTSCAILKPAEVSWWKLLRLSLCACVWIKFPMTVVMYINIT